VHGADGPRPVGRAVRMRIHPHPAERRARWAERRDAWGERPGRGTLGCPAGVAGEWP